MNLITPSKFKYTDEHLIQIRDRPHLLGHIAGKSKLTEMHSHWIRYMWDGAEDRALMAHRGSYKTTAMAIGVVRWMLFHPDDRIAVVRKTFTDAAEVVDMVRQIMEQPEIQALFYFAHGHIPKAKVKREGKLRYNFKYSQTPEGNVTAHGLDGSLTGHHYDKIWLDDVITLKDRVSRAERERSKEVIREISTNIVDPGKPVMYTGTPWHRDDAWNIILRDIEGQPLVHCLEYPISKCNILSPEEIAKKRKTTTPFLFAANYELVLNNNEDMLFVDPVYGNWNYHLPGAMAHLDAAYDGDHTCALTIMAPRGEGFQAKGWIYPGNVKDWMPQIVKYCKLHKVQILYNETNPDKGYSADKLKEYGLVVEAYPETQNKGVKISSYLYEVWQDIIWDDDTDEEYMNQILDWKMGEEPDDAPDSAASLIKKAFRSGSRADESLYEY